MDRVETLMKNLKISREDALSVIADDKAVDRGNAMPFDLSPEQQKIARAYARCGTRKITETKRKPKENPTKEKIISEIYDFLAEKQYEKCEIVNKNREIVVTVGGIDYSVTLIEHRKTKK